MAVEIPFDRAFTPKYGQSESLQPGLRRVLCNNPGPFTFYGTGTFIMGEGEVAVIDPGPDDPEHIDAILRAVEGETVSHILITHTHRDHSPAAAAIKAATGAPTYAYGPHGSGKLEQGVQVEEGGDMDFMPDHRIKHGEIITGSGWQVEAVHTPGHTSNHICFGWQEEGILFSGDHVMGWSTSIISPPDGDMIDYMASLDLLLKRNDKTYWPTHGAPIKDPNAYVQAFIAHRVERENDLLDRLANGPSSVEDLVPQIYIDLPDKMFPAAARSLFATALLLADRGDISTEDAASPKAVYRLTS